MISNPRQECWGTLRASERSAKVQRVLNGGLDPWGVGSANLGRPIFASNFPQIPLKQAFSRKLGAKMGRPQICRSNAPRIQSPTFKPLKKSHTEPAQGQQLQLKQTSDATCLFNIALVLSRLSACHSGRGA